MRRAYVCSSKKCDPPRRVFLMEGDPKPECPEHGQTMVQQENRPYPAPDRTPADD